MVTTRKKSTQWKILWDRAIRLKDVLLKVAAQRTQQRRSRLQRELVKDLRWKLKLNKRVRTAREGLLT